MRDIKPLSPVEIVKQYRRCIEESARERYDDVASRQINKIDAILSVFNVPYDWKNGSGISQWIESELFPINEQAAFAALQAVENLDEAEHDWQNLYYGIEQAIRTKE